MSKFLTLRGHLDLSGNFGQSAITTNMGSSESKFAGVNNIPFANTAIFAINSIIKSSEYVHYFNSKWLGMTSPHVVIVNNNNLRNESNYDREHVSGRNLHESFANHNMKLGDEYRITESQDPVNYSSQEGDSNEAEARILDRCWALADQLTSVNPVASRLSVKTNLIDFNFEIENGNLSLFIDGNAIVGDTGEIDLVEDDIDKREVAIREELDDESHDANAIIDNNFDDVNNQKKRKTLVSFDLDDETCVFYKSCSEFSGPNDEFVMSEDEEEEERMREHRLDLLKEQLMSTLQGPKCDEDCKSSVVEICAKIEEEINMSRRAVSVASEYSELIEDTEGYVSRF